MSNKIVLYDERLNFNIPERFQLLEQEENNKYLSGIQVDYVFSDIDKKAFITVTKTGTELSPEELEGRLVEYYQIYTRSVPNFANIKIAKKKMDNGELIGMFYYTSTTVERDLFNYFVLFSIEGKETIITMHCSVEDSLTIGQEYMSTLNSIEILNCK